MSTQICIFPNDISTFGQEAAGIEPPFCNTGENCSTSWATTAQLKGCCFIFTAGYLISLFSNMSDLGKLALFIQTCIFYSPCSHSLSLFVQAPSSILYQPHKCKLGMMVRFVWRAQPSLLLLVTKLAQMLSCHHNLYVWIIGILIRVFFALTV